MTLNRDEAVERWEVPRDLAKNQAEFLLDWHAIRFMEGTQLVKRPYASNPSSYLADDPNIIKRSETVYVQGPTILWDSNGKRFLAEGTQELKYHEINKDIISPIYNASNAPAILLVGDSVAQDTMMRNFAFLDLDSKKAIIVQWMDSIDDLGSEELNNFDVVMLYRYKYKSRSDAFKKLEKYVQSGGNLYIDTGTEQKESESTNLESLFPFDRSERKPLGTNWDWQINQNQVTQDVNFDNFGEPVYNNQGWSFSYPVGDIKSGADVIISNHQKPIFITYNLGKGKVIWSGMNFPGHLQRFKKEDEVKLFKNILSYFGNFSKDQNVNVSFERPSAEKVIIKGSDAKAILFKEAYYPGWDLKVESAGKTKKIPLYQAGPMYYGYMYAVLPEDMRGKPFIAYFNYHGELIYKVAYLVSFLAILIVLDFLLLKGWFVKLVNKYTRPFTGNISEWWEKEEEY